MDILGAVTDALRRMPSAVIAIWYPLTERARTEEFHHALLGLATPTLFAEVNIAGAESLLKMKGCGLLILNPPWQIDRDIRALLPVFRERLRAEAGASADCSWIVPEK